MGKANTNNKKNTDLERFASIYQALPIPTYTWQFIDEDFILIDFNKAAQAFEDPYPLSLNSIKASFLYKENPDIISDLTRCIIQKTTFNRNLSYVFRETATTTILHTRCIFIDSELIVVQLEEISPGKQLADKLAEHVNQLTHFIQDNPAAIIMFDKDMRYIAVSDKWLADYKLSGKQLIGKSHYEIFPEIRQEWKDIHQRCLKGASEKREEDSFMRYDGSIDWVRWEINPWYQASGEIGGIIMFTEVITERKKLEEALIASENRFHLLADNALVGIYILKDGKYTYVNNAMAKIFGYSVDEMLGMKQSELVFEEDAQKIENYVKKNSEVGQAQYYQFRGVHSSNLILDIEVFGSVTEINGRKAVIGTLIDITERKKTETLLVQNHNRIALQNEALLNAKEKIEASETRLIEAQEAAKVGSWETDLSNLHVIWSEETFHIFELDSNVFKPTHDSFLTYVHPDDKEMVDKAFKGSFSSKDYNSVEHRIVTSKGNVKFVEERWKVSFNEDGTPIRVFGTCQDISIRKKVEQELIQTKIHAEENEYRLKLAVEAAKLGIWDWHIIDDVLLWDDRVYDIYGLPKGKDSNVFDTWVDNLHPDDKERVFKEVDAALKGGKKFDTIFRILKPDKQIVHIKADAIVLHDQNGIPYRMIGMNNDITETVQYEERIKQSEEKQRALIENISDGIVLIDEHYNLLYQSPSVERIVGYTFEDRKSKKAIDFIHPDDVNTCLQQYEEARNNPGLPVQNQYRTRHKNGNYIWIEVAITNLLKLVSVQAYVVIYRDVTERKIFEEKLALSSLIVDSSHDAIMSITNEGVITSWNKGAEKVLGYTSEDAVGKSIYLLIPPALHDEEKDISERVKNKKVLDRYETTRIRKDGSFITVSLTVSPIIDEFGRVIGASKIMRDISQQRSIELEKVKIMNDLIQRNRDLEQFSYIISHNLRAPVANIMGISNLMLLPEIDPEEKERMITALNKSVGAMDTVIKDLNHILQIKREVNEQKTPVKFSELLKEIKWSISHLIKKENVELIADFTAIDEMVTIRSYLYSIFYNLITNSIKYKQPAISPVIQIKTVLAGNKVEIIFRDNGLGMDIEKKGDQLFKLYKRFHFHTEGKGMGLFMVKTQVETLGGNISVKSEINKGTEFKIQLGL